MTLPPTNTISATDAKRAARNVGVLMGASILSKGLLFAWQIVLNNWLGATQSGVYGTVLGLFAVIAPLTGLGMGMIAIREIAKTPERIGQYATIMLFSQTALSGLAYIVLVASGTIYGGDILAYTAIAGISLIIDMFGSIATDLFIAQEKMLITSSMEIVNVVIRVVLAGFALWAGWGLLGVYIATIISGIIRSGSLWAIHWVQKLQLDWHIDWKHIGIPMIIDTVPLAAGAALSLGYDHADKLMMTGIIGETNTGYLQPAFLIHFGIIELFSTAILVAMYPLMARYHSEKNENDTFGFIVEKLMRFMLMLALPVAIGLTIFSEDVIRLIFTDEFLPTIPILQVYVWYTLFTLVSNVFARALLIQNRQGYTLIVTGAALTLNIIVNYVLLTQTGNPIGAAIASVMAQAFALILLAQTFRANGFSWLTILPSISRLLVVGLVAGAVMIFVGQVFWILGLIAGSIVYLIGIFFGRVLSEADWDLLYRLTSALPFGSIIRRYWQRDITINW
ncbi:MAG: flippase [Phototrophicaceae bacterium]